MGGSKSCAVDTPAINPITLELKQYDNKSFVTGVEGSSRCNWKYIESSLPGNGGKIDIYKANPRFDEEYDTGKYCGIDGAKCDNQKGVSGVTNNPNDIGKSFVKSIPSYRVNKMNMCKEISSTNSSNKYLDKNSYRLIGTDNLNLQTIKYLYKGEFKPDGIYAGPKVEERKVNHNNGPEVVIKKKELTCLYHTTDDLYFFNDKVFEDWLYLIQTEDVLNQLLNDVRSTVDMNPGLIMLNKVSNQLGKFAKGLTKTSSFVDIPVGPALISMPSTYVLPKRHYHADYHIDNSIDANNVTYDMSKLNVNVVNAIEPKTSSDTYKATNYLDDSFTMINKLCAIDGKVDNETVISATIPKRGYQLFEAVSDNMDSGSDYRIKTTEQLVEITKIGNTVAQDNEFDETNKAVADIQHDTNTKSLIDSAGKVIPPRLIISFSELGSMLGSAYINVLKDKGDSIGVPVINFEYKDGDINIDINTLSDSKDNRAYIYVAKASNTLGSYSAGLMNKKDGKGVDIKFVSIAYDGAESKSTPGILKTRFDEED